MEPAVVRSEGYFSALLAVRCALLILGIAGLDLGFVAVSQALGWTTTSMVPMPADLFADYFKFVLSFPGGDAMHPSALAGLGARIAGYQASHDYLGIEGLGRDQLTNLHVTPITALFCLINVRAMAWVDPVLLFAAQLLALAGWWIALALRHAASRREGMVWAITGLACYPAAMMVLRGNLYAGAAGLLIIQAMLMAVRHPDLLRPAVLLALACCIRPNAAVFVLPLLALAQGERIRVLICFCTTGAVASLVGLWGAHALYPDYTLGSFRAALSVYYDCYVIRNDGVAYGSSAFGALKQLWGYQAGLATLAMLPAALITLATAALVWRRKLRISSLLFLTTAAYVLGSTIFGDYHLLPFLLPPMLLAREHESERMDDGARAILICSCLVLAPKNLIFPEQSSWQAIANPLILIAGSLQVLIHTWRASPGPNPPRPSSTPRSPDRLPQKARSPTTLPGGA